VLHPQVIVYENPGSPSRQLEELAAAGTGQLGPLLTPLARRREWLLREPRQRPACLSLLREGRPTLLALKLERKLIDELTLLAEAHAVAPEVPILVVHDAKPGTDQRDLIQTLAFDLGASCVLFPPMPGALLEEAAERLLDSCSGGA
jgi:hypothetical protein